MEKRGQINDQRLLLLVALGRKRWQYTRQKETIRKGFGLIGLLCCIVMLHARAMPADSLLYVDQLNQRAILSQQKQLDTTFLYATKAREIAARLDYKKGQADAWYALGNYYGLRDNKYLSIRYYVDALQAYKKGQDSIGISQMYVCLSDYYLQSGQYPAAIAYVQAAMNTGSMLRNDSVYALVLIHYASIHMTDPLKRDSVQWALTTARNTLTRYHDESALLRLDLLHIRRLLQQKDTIAAEEKMSSLITTAAGLGYNYIAMNTCRLMAATRAGMHQADSIQYRARMVALSVTGGYREGMLPYAIQLFDWYTSQGKQDSAAWYSGLLLNIVQRRAASKSEGEMDYISFYTQQHDIHSLQLKRAIQDKVLYKQQLESRIRLYMGVFLFVLLVLAMLTGRYFFRAYKNTKRNAVLLAARNREINEKNALLREHDDFKNMLVSVVAHDFRSPLSNIINIAIFLKEEMLTTEEATKWMVEVERTAGYTLQIFDNILAWISSQSSGFVYTPEACKPADMIREVLQYLEHSINDKQLRITIDIRESITVWANREMLQFVHRNLIHNAIKFSPANGTLHITAVTDKDHMTLSVADEGPGIPEEMLPHLFEYNNNKDNNRGQQGAGLALIICRDFIHKMNGQIKAGNQPGGGALLSYTLRLAKPQQL
jgi:signal transduction histidine kinase